MSRHKCADCFLIANLPNESPNSGTAHLIRHGTGSLRRTRELLARKKLPGLIQLQDASFVNYRAAALVIAGWCWSTRESFRSQLSACSRIRSKLGGRGDEGQPMRSKRPTRLRLGRATPW